MLEHGRDLVVCRHDEGKGARQVALEQSEQVVIMNDCVLRQLAHRLKNH